MQGDQRDVFEVDGKSVQIEASWERPSLWRDVIGFLNGNAPENPWVIGVFAIVLIVVMSKLGADSFVCVTGIGSVLDITITSTWRLGKREPKKSDQLGGELSHEGTAGRTSEPPRQ